MEKEENRNRKALKSGIWYTISSILVKMIAVISTPIFTRMMSPDDYGLVAIFLSWTSLLLPIFSLNLTSSVGRAKLDFEGELDNYIGSMQLLALVVSIPIAIVGIIFIAPISQLLSMDPKLTICLILYLLFAPSIYFFQNGCRYSYKYKANIAIAWYISIVTVVLSVVFLWLLPGDKAFLRTLGYVLPNVLLGTYIWGRSFWHRNISFNKEHMIYGMKISVPLIVHTVSMNILSQSDRIFIKKICGSKEAAIYSVAYSYGLLMLVLTNAISDSWLPWFHDNLFEKNHDIIRKNVKPIVGLGCFIGLASIALAPEAILVLGGEAYLEGKYCVVPIVVGVVCQYVYTHYVNIELHVKKTVYVSAGTIIAAVVNVVLNVLCIPRFGYIAAAYTTLVSYIALMVIHFAITRYIIKIKLYDDFFMFGSVALVGIAALILAFSYNYTVLRYCLLAVGFAIFCFLYRDKIKSIVNRNLF